MAIALNVTAKLSVNTGSTNISAPTFNQSVTPAGQNVFTAVQTIGTSSEIINVGDVTTIGYVLITNLDATNYVEIDNATGINVWPQKIKAGGFIILQPQSATLYAKANTGSVDIFISAVEV